MRRANLDFQVGKRMSQTLIVHLEKPIASAKVIDDYAGGVGSKLSGGGVGSEVSAEQIEGSQAQKTAYSQAYQALNAVVKKLNEFYDKVFVEQREEIAKLSVEIARKILMRKVEDGDYEIEAIVKEALKNAPSRQNVVVHLHPEDLGQCQKVQNDGADGALAGVKFVSDPKIGRAECVVESPKGIIESLINGHLERIGKALQKAE
jgi:flagellar biosynthesis/type III secretory pathway protein FliH